MAAPASILYVGDWTAPRLIAKRITQRFGELDTARLRYVSTASTPFSDGQAAPGMSGFYLDEVESEQQGGRYIHDCSAVGLAGQKRTKGHPQRNDEYLDWDTVTDEYLTTNANVFRSGQLGSYGGTTVCTSATSVPVLGGIFRVRGTFRGIITAKVRERTISSNGQTVSGDTITVNLPGGWNTPRKGQAQLPKVTVTDKYRGTSAPPTNLIPGPATPPNAPAVKIISVFGDVTRYWPAGWHLAGVSGTQIGTSGLWESEWHYEYQYPATP
jgi:hypothetical protein